jgi:hypothetical protein
MASGDSSGSGSDGGCSAASRGGGSGSGGSVSVAATVGEVTAAPGADGGDEDCACGDASRSYPTVTATGPA